MSRHVPATLPDLLQMSTRHLWQAEVLMRAGDRRDAADRMDAAHRTLLKGVGRG